MDRLVKYWRTLAAAPIWLYQKTLSFDHGPMRVLFPHGYCRYYPTCSEYMRLSIIKHGVVKGGLRGLYRIARCNPWSKGGVDLPQ